MNTIPVPVRLDPKKDMKSTRSLVGWHDPLQSNELFHPNLKLQAFLGTRHQSWSMYLGAEILVQENSEVESSSDGDVGP